MKKLLLIASGIVLFAAQAFASEEIIRPYRSIRNVGMGGLTTTTGVYEDALLNGNPAMHSYNETWKVSILNLTTETNWNMISDIPAFIDIAGGEMTDILTNLADNGLVGKNEHLSIANVTAGYIPHFLSQNNALSFGLLIGTQSNLMLRSTAEVDALIVADIGPSLGFSRQFLDRTLSIGFNAHARYRVASDSALNAVKFMGAGTLDFSEFGGHGLGVDGDVGVNYLLPWEVKGVVFSVGASANNLLASRYNLFSFSSGEFNSLPPGNDRTVNVGVRADLPDSWIFSKSLVAFEVQDILPNQQLVSIYKRLHFGAETRTSKWLTLRAGMNQGYLTGGVAINTPAVNIELATYGEEIGSNAGMMGDRRFVFKFGIEI